MQSIQKEKQKESGKINFSPILNGPSAVRPFSSQMIGRKGGNSGWKQPNLNGHY